MKNEQLAKTITSLLREVELVEQELNARITTEAKALLKEFDVERDAIAKEIDRGASQGERKGSFCALIPRHKHASGGTHALGWGRKYHNTGGQRTRDIKKAERGADFSVFRLTKQVPEGFRALVEETEAKSVELRFANRILVKLREAERLMREAQLPADPKPE